MRAIFRAQWQQLLHSPWAFLAMIVMSLLLAAVVGVQATHTLSVTVAPDSTLSPAQVDDWLGALNASQAFEFEVGDEAKAVASLESNGSGLVLRLGADSWQVLAVPNDQSAPELANFVASVYRERLTLQAAASGGSVSALQQKVDSALETPALTVRTTTVSAQATFAFDSRVQGALGMGLFFATFTILFGVNNMLEERRIGLWDRVIVSPVPKAGMYGGHMAFVFLSGVLQLVVVFALFRFVFGVSTGPNVAAALLVLAVYSLAITALGMLLAALVGNAAQMAVVIPIVAVSQAMLGGAFWPIEIVTNPALLFLSKVLPLRHAMDALKGLAYQGWGFAQVMGNMGYLAAFTVVCLVVGLWLIDRRGAS